MRPVTYMVGLMVGHLLRPFMDGALDGLFGKVDADDVPPVVARVGEWTR